MAVGGQVYTNSGVLRSYLRTLYYTLRIRTMLRKMLRKRIICVLSIRELDLCVDETHTHKRSRAMTIEFKEELSIVRKLAERLEGACNFLLSESQALESAELVKIYRDDIIVLCQSLGLNANVIEHMA